LYQDPVQASTTLFISTPAILEAVVSIYTLSDPVDDAVRYVGKTERTAEARLAKHLKNARERRDGKTVYNQHVYCWIRSLSSDPVMEVVEVTEDGVEAEHFWIAQFRAWGFKLTNHTDGGEGTAGYRHSADARVAQSKRLRGLPQTPARAAQLARVHDDLRGKPRPTFSLEWRNNMARAHGARPFIDQTGRRYENLVEAATALDLDKAKICLVLKGKRSHTGGNTFKYLE
jgi:hypothetical protein